MAMPMDNPQSPLTAVGGGGVMPNPMVDPMSQVTAGPLAALRARLSMQAAGLQMVQNSPAYQTIAPYLMSKDDYDQGSAAVSQARQDYLDNLKPPKDDPGTRNMMLGAAFGAPTKWGTFGESLGNAMGAAAQYDAQQKNDAKQYDLAKLKLAYDAASDNWKERTALSSDAMHQLANMTDKALTGGGLGGGVGMPTMDHYAVQWRSVWTSAYNAWKATGKPGAEQYANQVATSVVGPNPRDLYGNMFGGDPLVSPPSGATPPAGGAGKMIPVDKSKAAASGGAAATIPADTYSKVNADLANQPPGTVVTYAPGTFPADDKAAAAGAAPGVTPPPAGGPMVLDPHGKVDMALDQKAGEEGIRAGQTALDKMRDASMLASRQLPMFDRMVNRSVNNEVFTGPWQGFATKLGSWLTNAGVITDPSLVNKISNSEADYSDVLKQAQQSLRAFEGANSITNFDMLMQMNSAPTLTKTPEGRMKILEALRADLYNVKQMYQDANDYYKQNRNLNGWTYTPKQYVELDQPMLKNYSGQQISQSQFVEAFLRKHPDATRPDAWNAWRDLK